MDATGRERSSLRQKEDRQQIAMNIIDSLQKKDKKVKGEAFSTIGNDLPIEEDVSREEEMSP